MWHLVTERRVDWIFPAEKDAEHVGHLDGECSRPPLAASEYSIATA